MSEGTRQPADLAHIFGDGTREHGGNTGIHTNMTCIPPLLLDLFTFTEDCPRGIRPANDGLRFCGMQQHVRARNKNISTAEHLYGVAVFVYNNQE